MRGATTSALASGETVGPHRSVAALITLRSPGRGTPLSATWGPGGMRGHHRRGCPRCRGALSLGSPRECLVGGARAGSRLSPGSGPARSASALWGPVPDRGLRAYCRPLPPCGKVTPDTRAARRPTARTARPPFCRHGVGEGITLLKSRVTLARSWSIAVMAAKSSARPHQPLSSRTLVSPDIEAQVRWRPP